METRKTVDLPVLQRVGSVEPKTFNQDQNTVEVIFTTGARVRRDPFFSESFFEELDLRKSAVDLSRLKNGAPFLNNHQSGSLEDIIGVVESASVDGERGVATVRLTDRPEAQSIVNDIKAGIIRNISVGYFVNQFKEMGEQDGLKVFRATKWTPAEISAVAIPADAGAQFRNLNETHKCEVIEMAEKPEMETRDLENEKPEMENQPEPQAPEATPEPEARQSTEEVQTMDEMKVRDEAVKLERKRCDDIKHAVRAAGLDSELEDSLINDGKSIEDAHKEIFERLAEKNKAETRNINPATITRDEVDTFKVGMVRAALNKYNPGKYECKEEAEAYRFMSLTDMAREYFKVRNVDTRGWSQDKLAKRALHSSSDFPELLANSANKVLRDAYAESPQTYAPITRVRLVRDFKEQSRIQLGDAEKLEVVAENAEYKQGTVGESKEVYSLLTYGKIVSLSRQMMINDDLGGFLRMSEILGRRARDLESDLVWGQITSNPLMGDGVALFDAAHGNLGSAAAIAVASIGAGRAAMRVQTGLDGLKLNIQPRYLIVPAELETVADQFVSSITPDQGANVNPFANRLQVIAEPRLDDASTSNWYLAADAGQLDIIELARLEGEDGPMIEQEEGFKIDGMSIKIRMDVAAKVIDHRGLFKNPN